MADDTETGVVTPKKTIKKRGLPPISSQSKTEEDDTEIKPVKRKPKKKKPAEGTASNGHTSPAPADESETKPAPRRRRKRSPSEVKDDADEKPSTGSTTTTPRKKKRKPKPESTDNNQGGDVAETTQAKDGQGSKTSLISKDGGTPRKKAGKKKKKVKKTVDSEEYGDSPWAEDLRYMTEDIISGEAADEGEEELNATEDKKTPVTKFFSTPILRSQPLDKIFIETSSKFKGQSKSTLAKKREEETIQPTGPDEVTRMTTIDFALNTHKIFRVITLFLHGLTAGLALWQMVTVFTLATFSSDDFLEHYYRLAMPLQGSLYFLLIMCTVSACDRFDIGNPSRRFVFRALTLQNGAVSIVFCLIALILNVIIIRYDDKMDLYKDYLDLYTSENMKADDIDTFRSLNTARSVFIILSWFILSVTPNSDRLGKSLKSGETGLEKEMELEKVSSA